MKWEWKPLTWSDKELFNNLFSKNPAGVSELTFTNLIIWSSSRPVEFRETDGGIFLKSAHAGEPFLYPPIGFDDLPGAYGMLFDHAVEDGLKPVVLRAPKEHAGILKDTGYKIVPDPDNFDYIYRVSDLAYLRGRHYDGKRGFVRKFMTTYDFSFRPYESSDYEDCIDLLKRWMARKGGENPVFLQELDAMRELMRHFDETGLESGVLTVDNRMAAFSFGERIVPGTCVIHFEKADTSYEGSYQAINFLFARDVMLDKYEFVNREQDMGIPGLRKAKQSYLPVTLVEKYNIEK